MLFDVQAVDSQGKGVNLKIEADTESSAATRVRADGFFPVNVQPPPEHWFLRASMLPMLVTSAQEPSAKEVTSQFVVRNCPACRKAIAVTVSKCPHCGANAPIGLLTVLLALGIAIGLPLLFWFTASLPVEERIEHRKKSNPPESVSEYAESPSQSTSPRTSQELLKEYHRQGRFTGYTDGDELIRDWYNLKEAEKEISGRGY
jgi:hypothetical protein